MNKYMCAVLLIIFSLPLNAAEEVFDFKNITDSNIHFKHMLTNTGILVNDESINKKTLLADRILSIFYNNPADRNVCEDLPFIKEIAIGSCSGVLIQPNLVATAGHCVDQRIFDKTWFFNYQQGDDLAVKPGYKVGRIIFRHFDLIKSGYSFERNTINRQRQLIGMSPLPPDMHDYSGYRDIALLELTENVNGYIPFHVNFSPFSEGKKAVSIGYPLGLSLKQSSTGTLKILANPYYMTTNIETLQGNSGGPLFDVENGDLIGITVNKGLHSVFGYNEDKHCYGFKSTIANASQISQQSGHMTLSQVQPYLSQ